MTTHRLRALGRGPATVLVLATMALPTLVATVPAGAADKGQSERYPLPPGKVFTLHGRGYGHGHGMSQWGAYGAAKVGHLSANQILAFYYPHTTLATVSTRHKIRVLLTAVDAPATGYVQVAPATGLSVRAGASKATVLPTESTAPTKGGPTYAITAWRLQQTGSSVSVRGQWNARWHTTTKNAGTNVSFSDAAGILAVTEPAGAGATKTIRYRGSIAAEVRSGDLEAVDAVPIESYVAAVVPSEMPASWPGASLRAQAVAARTYAWRLIDHPKASWFDLFGDTRDQGYGGVGSQTAPTNAAVHATAGLVAVDSSGDPILAQYSSADGGWTASGGLPYLPAKSDPYDGAIPNDAHAWTTTISTAAIGSAYPTVGKVKELLITGRDGRGLWGGRVTAISVVGSQATVQTSGVSFQAAFGLRSYWFRPTPPPGAPRRVKAAVSRKSVTVTWKPPAAVSGAAPITGYYIALRPGRHTTSVAASSTSATLTKLPKGTYTVTVVTKSNAGPSLATAAAAPVVVKAGS